MHDGDRVSSQPFLVKLRRVHVRSTAFCEDFSLGPESFLANSLSCWLLPMLLNANISDPSDSYIFTLLPTVNAERCPNSALVLPKSLARTNAQPDFINRAAKISNISPVEHCWSEIDAIAFSKLKKNITQQIPVSPTLPLSELHTKTGNLTAELNNALAFRLPVILGKAYLIT